MDQRHWKIYLTTMNLAFKVLPAYQCSYVIYLKIHRLIQTIIYCYTSVIWFDCITHCNTNVTCRVRIIIHETLRQTTHVHRHNDWQKWETCTRNQWIRGQQKHRYIFVSPDVPQMPKCGSEIFLLLHSMLDCWVIRKHEYTEATITVFSTVWYVFYHLSWFLITAVNLYNINQNKVSENIKI